MRTVRRHGRQRRAGTRSSRSRTAGTPQDVSGTQTRDGRIVRQAQQGPRARRRRQGATQLADTDPTLRASLTRRRRGPRQDGAITGATPQPPRRWPKPPQAPQRTEHAAPRENYVADAERHTQHVAEQQQTGHSRTTCGRGPAPAGAMATGAGHPPPAREHRRRGQRAQQPARRGHPQPDRRRATIEEDTGDGGAEGSTAPGRPPAGRPQDRLEPRLGPDQNRRRQADAAAAGTRGSRATGASVGAEVKHRTRSQLQSAGHARPYKRRRV